MNHLQSFFGELVGTFILVFIGCSAVALSVLSTELPTLLHVAIVWGLGVAAAIYAVRKYCPAHLNPAVSVAFFLNKSISGQTLLRFILGQLIGAIIAGMGVYFIFNETIIEFETKHQLIRGTEASHQTAKIFGEFFPNPGSGLESVSLITAMLSEAAGTFGLMLVIFLIGNTQRKINQVAPLMIGLTITILILIIAPYTQGGFNPARDFGPRLVAYFGGWSNAAFPTIPLSFLTVYILSPILGSMAAYFIFKQLVK